MTPPLLGTSLKTTPPSFTPPSPGVVEFALLLPKDQANELIELSRRRSESVAQILRSWIQQGLLREELAKKSPHESLLL